MKNVFMLIIVVVAIMSIVLAVRYNKNAYKIQQDLNNERYSRMVAEENLQNATVKISSLENKLTKNQEKIQSIQTSLDRAKTTNDELTKQLKGVADDNEMMAQKIEELNTLILQTTGSVPAGGL